MLFIKNLTKAKIDKKFLRHVAEKTLTILPGFSKNAEKTEIGLIIIGVKRMKNLNRVWRGKNKVTDVLSFGNQALSKSKSIWQAKTNPPAGGQKFKFIVPQESIHDLGQIFICYPVVARQARKDSCSPKEEMARLLVHGILHLAGYDHEKSASRAQEMFELQEKIAGKIRE